MAGIQARRLEAVSNPAAPAEQQETAFQVAWRPVALPVLLVASAGRQLGRKPEHYQTDGLVLIIGRMAQLDTRKTVETDWRLLEYLLYRLYRL